MPRRRNENVFIYPYGIVDEPTKELGLGVRHFQALLMCLCLLMATCIMSMYSVTINAMYKDGSASLEWSIHKIKASFFVGYVMAQIPACIFANKFGGKILVAISIFLSGMLNISIPLGISRGGWIAFQMMRLLQGLCIGCVLPSVNTLLGQWAPANERTRLTYLVYGGIPMGVILAELVSKYLIDSSFGWPSSFYLFGVVCSFMGCIWWYLGYDTPNKHKFISREEKEYINESIGKETCNEGSNELPRSKMIIPWWSMATSVPVWTYCVTLTGTTTSFLIFLVKIPRFFKEVYGIPWSQNIFLMVLPYVLIWITGICLASLSDHLVRKNIMSISDVRRVSNTIGTVCPATCLLILCVIPPNFALLLTIAFIIIGLFGAVNTGIMINNIDLTPNFAGLIYGISNKIAITTAFTVIAILDLFSDLSAHSYWKMMFYSMGSINIFSNLLFLICGSAERQKWDNPIYILQTRQEPKP